MKSSTDLDSPRRTLAFVSDIRSGGDRHRDRALERDPS